MGGESPFFNRKSCSNSSKGIPKTGTKLPLLSRSKNVSRGLDSTEVPTIGRGISAAGLAAGGGVVVVAAGGSAAPGASRLLS